jgi:transcriptional regulator with XRE-family HTH domain
MVRPLKTLDPHTYAERVGAAIRARRLALGISVEAAAVASGIAASSWYAIEQGHKLSVDRLPLIAAALKCRPAKLLPWPALRREPDSRARAGGVGRTRQDRR